MFNDNLLIGKYDFTLDKKGRMFLPASTSVEGGETIIIKKSVFKTEKCLQLYAYKEIVEQVKMLKNKMENCSDFEQYKKFEREFQEYFLVLNQIIRVDGQHRVSISKALLESIELEAPCNIYIVGLGNSLVLTKNPIKY